MARTTITKTYRGKASAPVSWDALLRIFDALWGSEARSLPRYPSVIGGVFARWTDDKDAENEAESLDEIKQAYERSKVVSITFSGMTKTAQERNFNYRPLKIEANVMVEASDAATAEELIKAVSYEFPLIDSIERYVFISYETRAFALAKFVADLVERRMPRGIRVFVAKRDIEAGANPQKVMLEDQLLGAEALLALCSIQSKRSSWLWWESSAVWARGGLVIPLFVNISPEEFGGPLILVCQGRSLFDEAELNSALSSLAKRMCPDYEHQNLTPDEVASLQQFQRESI